MALVLWLSVAPAGQPLSLAMRDDPSDLRPRKRFQPDGEVTAADARGGARTAIPLGPAVQAAAEAQRVQNGVVQEAGRIEKVIAAGDSGDSTLGGGDIEAVTRRKIPFPDDADTSTAGIAGGRRRQPELQVCYRHEAPETPCGRSPVATRGCSVFLRAVARCVSLCDPGQVEL